MHEVRQQRISGFYGGEDPRNLPAYSFAEASRYLRIPSETIRTWVSGRPYPTASGFRSFEPLIHLPETSKHYKLAAKTADQHNHRGKSLPVFDLKQLSFTNLIEIYVLATIRREYEIPINKVRAALDYISQEMEIAHPLARMRFYTDRLDLFIEHLDLLVNASKKGQIVIKQVISDYIQRIDWDEEGIASCLYPLTRSGEPSDSPKLVVINPKVAFGRPVVVDTGIPTDILAERFKAGEDLSELAEDYGCSLEKISEAIRYEISFAA